MGDMAEDFRVMKAHRKEYRRHCHECPACKVKFGTGTKVGPNQRCKHCRWRAPNVSALDGLPYRGLPHPKTPEFGGPSGLSPEDLAELYMPGEKP